MKRKNKYSVVEFGIFWSFLYLIGVVAIVAGWVMNIIQITQTIGNEITFAIILKFIGIFVFPLGSILGWVG